MSALNGHKFIVIGDSYTVGITGGGATIDSWLDYFVRWYGNEWAGYYESAVGGYGFARSDDKLFIDLLNALDNEISDKAGVTDILVAGGYNDGNEYSINHMESAISTFATTARQKYVNATLWIAPIGWTTNQHQANVKRAIDSYIQYGEAYGYRVLTEMQYVMRNTAYLSSDEIHPNADGYQALARKMYSCLISYLTGVKIAYNGADKWKIRATELLNQGGSGGGGNVTFNNTGTGMTASNVQAAIEEIDGITDDLIATSTNITRYSGISSSVPLPAVSRRGKLVIIHFAHQLPAGTYTNLWNVTPAPASQQHALVAIGNSWTIVAVTNAGVVKFNNSVTINSDQYVIGQIVYNTN